MSDSPSPFDVTPEGRVPAVTRTEALAWLSSRSGDPRAALLDLLRGDDYRILTARTYCRNHERPSRFSSTPQMVLPSLPDVVDAFCRERGLRYATGQVTAENALGMSTQVPAILVVALEGCQKSFSAFRQRILFEPAPDLVFEMSGASAMLVQATRRFERDGKFHFPHGDFERHAGIMKVARRMARFVRPSFVSHLRQDLPKLPKPWKKLAQEVVRAHDAALPQT